MAPEQEPIPVSDAPIVAPSEGETIDPTIRLSRWLDEVWKKITVQAINELTSDKRP